MIKQTNGKNPYDHSRLVIPQATNLRHEMLDRDLASYQWITTPAAQPFLELAAAREETPNLVSLLRRDLTADQTAAVLSQVALRRRAGQKFSAAPQMFFTEKGLEQATDEAVAEYKANAYPCGEMVADLCCGIGGDLLALGRRGPVTGVDRDPECAAFAKANCQAVGLTHVSVERQDVKAIAVRDYGAWHLDPDRRPGGRRTTSVPAGEPNETVIEQMLMANADGGIKLAAAANVSPQWDQDAQLEWLGTQRECKQLFAKFGRLASRPGQRTATVLDRTGQVVSQFSGQPSEAECVENVVRFVYDPHPTLAAAKLVGRFANQHQLAAVCAGVAYLTAEHLVCDPLVAAFEVLDYMPFDARRLKATLRARQWGSLEVKKRGIDLDPNVWQRRLRVPGDGEGVLLVTRLGVHVTAILAKRVTAEVEHNG